jgi:hypothetical protein
MALKENKLATRLYNVVLALLTFSGFCFTMGQFVPVYFVNTETRAIYYLVLFVILVITMMIVTFKMSYYPQEKNLFSSLLISLVFGAGTFIVTALWILGLLFGVWKEGTTYYVKKRNPEIKVISRYKDSGAYGGGTEQGDFHLVVHRPFLYFLKIETAADTISINKEEWIKPGKF